MKQKVGIIVAILCLFAMGVVQAEKPAAEAVKLTVSQTVPDTLKALIASQARATVVLKSGREYNGFVKEVGNGHVVLTRLAQRDFFDAMIRLDEISAVEVQIRRN